MFSHIDTNLLQSGLDWKNFQFDLNISVVTQLLQKKDSFFKRE